MPNGLLFHNSLFQDARVFLELVASLPELCNFLPVTLIKGSAELKEEASKIFRHKHNFLEEQGEEERPLMHTQNMMCSEQK